MKGLGYCNFMHMNIFHNPKMNIMRTQFLRLVMSILLLLFVGTGCKENEQKCTTVAVEGPEDDVVGKWKQVKGKTVFDKSQIVDYSCNNIIYNFKSDGSLSINSDIDNPIGYNSGEYIYEFSQHSLYENIDENYTLKIDNSNWACSISGSNMVLNNAPLDGPILYFVRIK